MDSMSYGKIAREEKRQRRFFKKKIEMVAWSVILLAYKRTSERFGSRL